MSTRSGTVHTDVLGPAPAPGQTEAFAAYRAAWRTLGRPEIDREEQELSNGQLHVRVRAANREEAWGPRYVGNELAGTRQAAAHHHQTAALRDAEAAAAHDLTEQARLSGEGRDADALARLLDEQTTALEELDDVRSRWLVHTAETRARGERAKAELALRHADDLEPEPQVTAEEWLAADAAARVEDDAHREITEHDLYDDRHDRGSGDHHDDAADVVVEPDVREIAADEPAPVDEDVVRVPTAAETADALDVARRALAEISARQALDEAEVAAQRADELHRWQSQDHAAEFDDGRADESATDDY